MKAERLKLTSLFINHKNNLVTAPARSSASAFKRGSATMEYVIVSTFAALLSIAAITFVGRLVKGRVDKMASKLNMEATEFDLSFE